MLKLMVSTSGGREGRIQATANAMTEEDAIGAAEKILMLAAAVKSDLKFPAGPRYRDLQDAVAPPQRPDNEDHDAP
jgi:hypothetical protein